MAPAVLFLLGLAPQLAVNPPQAPAAASTRPDFDRYQVQVADWQPQLRVELVERSGTQADLYLRRGAPPTRRAWDLRSATSGTANETVVVNAASAPELRSGTWHVGVWREPGTGYDIDIRLETVPSSRPGMGATLYANPGGGTEGTAFRVWAPFASGVSVTGSFNGWSGSLSPLAPEGNGNWSLDVRNAGAGTRYQYVIDAGQWTQWRNDPRAAEVTSSAGDSVVVDHDAFAWQGTFSTPAWNDMVVYELHVGTFNDLPGGGPGTLVSARSRLDHLADLGVNVIELMPVCEFQGDFSWGYNYSYPFAPESAYGGVDGLKAFVQAAHARGIAVVLDVLYNHWGPGDLDLWQFDGWSQSGYGGIYFYNDARASTPWGDTRPDYGRAEVRQYIRDNALFWLDEYRLDGLRFDATSFIRTGPLGDLPEGWSLLQWINDEIDARQPWKVSIAEDMWTNEWVTRPSGGGGAGFDSQWDPQFVHPVRAALIEPSDPNRSMWAVRDALGFRYNGDAFERVIYTESHDEVANGQSRLPEAIWPGNAASWFSKKRSTLGAALVMTAPGIPMLFQGQEILEDGWFDVNDPVDWSRLVTFSGIRDLYRDLIRLRRNWFDNTRGLRGQGHTTHHVNDTDKVVAFHRWDQGGPGDDVIVLANFANRSWTSYRVGFPRGGTWHVRFNSDWSGYDPAFGGHPAAAVNAVAGAYDGMPFHGDVSIGPYTAVILSQ